MLLIRGKIFSLNNLHDEWTGNVMTIPGPCPRHMNKKIMAACCVEITFNPISSNKQQDVVVWKADVFISLESYTLQLSSP